MFDVGLLLEDERADAGLWRTFLVYLTCSPKPAWKCWRRAATCSFEATFEAHFSGMTTEPISAAALLEKPRASVGTSGALAGRAVARLSAIGRG